jgi:hypothetical protein
LPRLESLRLPTNVEVLAANVMRVIGRSCRHICRIHVNVSVKIYDICSDGDGPLFLNLNTLVLRLLQFEKKQKLVNGTLLSRGVASYRKLEYMLCFHNAPAAAPALAAADRLQVIHLLFPNRKRIILDHAKAAARCLEQQAPLLSTL